MIDTSNSFKTITFAFYFSNYFALTRVIINTNVILIFSLNICGCNMEILPLDVNIALIKEQVSRLRFLLKRNFCFSF